jgi:hypothetical protein
VILIPYLVSVFYPLFYTWPKHCSNSLVVLTDIEFQLVIFSISFYKKFDIHCLDFAFVSLCNSLCFIVKCWNVLYGHLFGIVLGSLSSMMFLLQFDKIENYFVFL